MNTKEYIESGTLDLYVAGLLSVEEMRDVELKACQYAEIKTEIQTMQTSLEKYAMKHAIIPPTGLKEKIMKVVEGGNEKEKSKPVVREISASKSSFAMYLVAASIALLLVAGVIAFRYASQVNDYKQQVAELQNAQSRMQNEMNTLHESMMLNQQQVAMLSDTNTMHITMKGTQNHPSALAMIYWNKQTQAVYLEVKNLPAAPGDKQYQLWFIDPVKGPVSAGVFDVSEGIHQMVNAPAAAAFAVTLEKHGGSENPTMEQMYVIGKVSS